MKIPFRWISRFVISYMLLACFWWALNLWQENDRLFDAEKNLLELQFTRKNQGLNETEFFQTVEYKRIDDRRRMHQRMVIAEGLFFTACLIFGFYIINRSASREVSLTRQRRNFMLSITHELKSPIASLRLILETISKRDLQREQLEKLSANGIRDAARLQNLVESLLLAARLEDNWRPLFEPVDLGAIARESVAALQVRFSSARFLVHIQDHLPLVQADKSGLTSVIMNLLENAAKYSGEQAEITFSAEKTASKLRFQVRDNGPGIPDEEKSAVFEKFYRIENEEVRRSTGTGLGLYIVREVIKAHKGTITVSNNQPSGTVFTIDL